MFIYEKGQGIVCLLKCDSSNLFWIQEQDMTIFMPPTNEMKIKQTTDDRWNHKKTEKWKKKPSVIQADSVGCYILDYSDSFSITQLLFYLCQPGDQMMPSSESQERMGSVWFQSANFILLIPWDLNTRYTIDECTLSSLYLHLISFFLHACGAICFSSQQIFCQCCKICVH